MDNNIVIYSKLKDLFQTLWNKVKEKFNASLVEVGFNEDSNVLTFRKGDNTPKEINLKKFVEHWGDLRHVTQSYKYENLLDYDSRVDGKFFPNAGTGDVQDAWHWSIFHCPVKPNEEYTVFRKFSDSGRYVFYNAQGGVEQVIELNRSNLVNDWHRNYVQVPNNPNVAHMAFCFQTYATNLNTKGRIMLLKESNITEPLEFIPYLPNEKVIIDGDKVAISFNNDSTNLTATNVVGAIKELDGRITNAGTGGAVTSVNGQQGVVTLNGTHINADMGGSTNSVQAHLQKVNGDVSTLNGSLNSLRNDLNNTNRTVNTLDNRLTNVEAKRHATQVGEIVSVLTTDSRDYTISGTTFLYLGNANKTVSSNTYPQLASAFGLTNVNSFTLPVISDVNVRYDNVRNITRKHFICAKKTP